MKPSEMTTVELLEAVGRRMSLYMHSQTREEGEELLARAGTLAEYVRMAGTPGANKRAAWAITVINAPSALREGQEGKEPKSDSPSLHPQTPAMEPGK